MHVCLWVCVCEREREGETERERKGEKERNETWNSQNYLNLPPKIYVDNEKVKCQDHAVFVLCKMLSLN